MTKSRLLTDVPLYASLRTAARLLDMGEGEFERLVASGAMPPAKRIGEIRRWRVADLDAILTGDARRPEEDIE